MAGDAGDAPLREDGRAEWVREAMDVVARQGSHWIMALVLLGSVGTAIVLASPSTGIYAMLFGWSLLAATLVPLPSEAPLAALVYDQREWVAPVIVATLGNYLGACATYGVARWAADRAGLQDTLNRAHRRVVSLVARYGAPVMLLSWVPIVGDALVAVAGAVAMPFVRFSIAVLVGKVARYTIVAWVALRM